MEFQLRIIAASPLVLSISGCSFIEEAYDLSQGDFYQLFAYGHKYRNGTDVPKLVLIYPCWSGLEEALPVFDYGNGMNLWVLPFDLDKDRLQGAESAGIPLRQAGYSQTPLEMSA